MSEPKAIIVADLHPLAHERCFIANSIKTAVAVSAEP